MPLPSTIFHSSPSSHGADRRGGPTDNRWGPPPSSQRGGSGSHFGNLERSHSPKESDTRDGSVREGGGGGDGGADGDRTGGGIERRSHSPANAPTNEQPTKGAGSGSGFGGGDRGHARRGGPGWEPSTHGGRGGRGGGYHRGRGGRDDRSMRRGRR